MLQPDSRGRALCLLPSWCVWCCAVPSLAPASCVLPPQSSIKHGLPAGSVGSHLFCSDHLVQMWIQVWWCNSAGGSRGRESCEDLCGRCLEPVRGAEGEERHNRHPAEEERVSEKRGQFGRPCKEPFFSYPTTSCFYSPKLATVVQDNYRLH